MSQKKNPAHEKIIGQAKQARTNGLLKRSHATAPGSGHSVPCVSGWLTTQEADNSHLCCIYTTRAMSWCRTNQSSVLPILNVSVANMPQEASH